MRYLSHIYCTEIGRVTFFFFVLEMIIIYFPFSNYLEFPMFLIFQK